MTESHSQEGQQAARPQPPDISVTVDSPFKMVFLCIFSLTVGLIVARVWIAIDNPAPSENLKDALATLTWMFTGGFGTLTGLFAGKQM